jgi:hypothetical protein
MKELDVDRVVARIFRRLALRSARRNLLPAIEQAHLRNPDADNRPICAITSCVFAPEALRSSLAAARPLLK